MKPYNEIKFTNTILLFRVGDFYERFGKDARKCSKVLNIVLTKRNKKSPIDLAGCPHHSINNYLPKLVKAGFQIGISFLDISTGEFLVGEGNKNYLNIIINMKFRSR